MEGEVEVEVTMTWSPEVLTLLWRTNQSRLPDQSCIVWTRVNSFLELVKVLRTIVPNFRWIVDHV